ncbi:MAG: DUF3833 domain-containing protein [Pseudomonadota bacterium]
MKRICTVFAGLLYVLTGCSSLTTEDYADQKPVMDIRQFLNGKLEAWGVLIDYSGKADMHFHATMNASWSGNVGTFHEDFVYSTGRKESRTWTITMTDDHHFTATAGDIEGTAIGTQHGNAAHLRYRLNAKRDSGGTIQLSMDDWLYLVDEKTVMNRTKMRKFGLTVGELMITIKKQ